MNGSIRNSKGTFTQARHAKKSTRPDIYIYARMYRLLSLFPPLTGNRCLFFCNFFSFPGFLVFTRRTPSVFFCGHRWNNTCAKKAEQYEPVQGPFDPPRDCLFPRVPETLIRRSRHRFQISKVKFSSKPVNLWERDRSSCYYILLRLSDLLFDDEMNFK